MKDVKRSFFYRINLLFYKICLLLQLLPAYNELFMANNKPFIYPLGIIPYLLLIVPYLLVALYFCLIDINNRDTALFFLAINCLIQFFMLRRLMAFRYYNGNRPRIVVGAQTIFIENILYVKKNFLGLKVFYKDDFYNKTCNCTVWVKDPDQIIQTFNFKVE